MMLSAVQFLIQMAGVFVLAEGEVVVIEALFPALAWPGS